MGRLEIISSNGVLFAFAWAALFGIVPTLLRAVEPCPEAGAYSNPALSKRCQNQRLEEGSFE
jgi:hypothetical protein